MNSTKELERHESPSKNGETIKNSKQKGESQEIQTQQEAHVTKQEVETPQGVERTRQGRVYNPEVDIYETKDAVTILADMPGVDNNSVDVTLEKNVLTIYGRVNAPQPAGYSPVYAEYGLGDYQRSFTISNEINWEGIEGIVKYGVLRLTLPKTGPAQARKIAIKSEA